MAAIPLQRDDVYYPDSDGKPMAETEFHLEETIYLIEALKDRFRHAQDVYVGGDMFLYYVKGSPQHSVAPDVFVVLGVPKKKRRTYKLWEEGQPPTLVVEVTSADSRREDQVRKKALYERLGVAEYILYDPLGEYLNPRLQGFRMLDGSYVPIPYLEESRSLQSHAVGLTFHLEDSRLRLIETLTGQLLLRGEEARELARSAKSAKEEVERLRAELERLRGQIP